MLPNSSLYLKGNIFQKNQKLPNNRATFAKKIVTKNFEKSSNLVTLLLSEASMLQIIFIVS